MKYLVLLGAGLFLSISIQAQSPKSDLNKGLLLTPPISMKVSLNENKLAIVYENREIADASTQVLDSILKKVPDLKNLKIDFEGINAEPEKKKLIEAVLKQCNCPIARHMISFNRQR